jgi:DNA replication and repair protein RecF
MKLLSLHVQNFRNIEKLDLNFKKSINSFVGQNAQGKTNILEAISLLAFGKSLHHNSEKSLRKIGTEFFRIQGIAENTDQQKITIEIAADANTKTFKLNGKKINASRLVGNFPVVSFSPEDLNLLLLSPTLRRRYLDILLSQTSSKYLRALSIYLKVLKNRNALLARISENLAQVNELDFWDKELANHGSVLGRMRSEFVNFATEPLLKNFQKISNETKILKIKIANFHGDDITPEKYFSNLIKLRDKDLRYANTNYGVHRADLIFELDDELLAENGSRGEIRSAVLALKFVELEFLKKNSEENPVLLLDDVFSELDSERQTSLMNMIQNYQTFITTTKLTHLNLIQNKSVWEVIDGSASYLSS